MIASYRTYLLEQVSTVAEAEALLARDEALAELFGTPENVLRFVQARRAGTEIAAGRRAIVLGLGGRSERAGQRGFLH